MFLTRSVCSAGSIRLRCHGDAFLLSNRLNKTRPVRYTARGTKVSCGTVRYCKCGFVQPRKPKATRLEWCSFERTQIPEVLLLQHSVRILFTVI